MRNADDLRRRQRVVLARLYPSSVSLQPILANIADMRKKLSMFRKAIRDQTLALAKLNDASNLLLLIADHVQILTSCYANSCTSSSSDWSSDDDAVRVGCLGRSEESRSPIYLSSVPANYRVRYLRRCWGFASDALVAAVDFSSYLSCQLERDGQTQLVPGIEGLSRPSMSLFELPGGLTVVFRSEMLQKMANDAKEMREIVGVWQLKQRKFISRIRKDMGRLRKSIGQQEIVVCGLRQKLLAEEFGSRFEVDS